MGRGSEGDAIQALQETWGLVLAPACGLVMAVILSKGLLYFLHWTETF